MPDPVPAWLLNIASNIQLAIAEHEAAEYLEDPEIHYVPMTPAYSKNIIIWQDRMVPLIDLNVLYGNPATTDYRSVIVIAYQQKEYMPLQYIALVLAASPDKIFVSDEDACGLPENYPESLRPCTLSLFQYNNQITSVIDMARFSAGDL
jgi:chemotaxis signal transduction protein